MRRLFGMAVAMLLLVACSTTINSLWINRETESRRWVINNPVLASDIRVLDVKEEEKRRGADCQCSFEKRLAYADWR